MIEAFNQDTPFDRFIREQIAGDAMGKDAATGFLVTASVLLPGQIGKDAPSMRLARQDSLDEIVVNISQTFLGMTVGCARCHNHKFDPITTQDYYALQAFIAGVKYEERELRSPEADARRAYAEQMKNELRKVEGDLARYVPLYNSGVERMPVSARVNTDRFPPVTTKHVRFTIETTNRLEPCIDELEVFDTEHVNVALASRGATVASSGDTVVADRHELRFIHDGEYGNSRSWMSNEMGGGWVVVTFPQEREIDRVIWGRDRLGRFDDRLATTYRIEVTDASGAWRTVADSSDRTPFGTDRGDKPIYTAEGLDPDDLKRLEHLRARKKSLEQGISKADDLQMVFAGAFDTPDDIHVLLRGDPEQPLKEVGPAIPELFGPMRLADDTNEQDRRIALAQWLVSESNPLTARVMVNRIWQGHFGVGLVSTPNDFGRNGVKPTHPQLLDWLAAEFVRSGWSIKHMHRLITLSSTYRQSTDYNSAAAAKDADTRWLWRFPSRRIEGEAIRDTILAISGRLNLTMGGRGFDLFDKRGGLSGFQPVEVFEQEGLRRMIYAHKVRRETDAVFGAFDCPDGGQSAPRRRESTTPIQALNLFNSRFVLDASQAFADRVARDVGASDTAAQVVRAYELALSRQPTAEELADALPIVSDHGLATLCRALINSNEFLFLP